MPTVAESIRLPAAPAARMDTAPGARTTPDVATLQGLCQTCELRTSCGFPRLPGGVWHCEEFI